MVTCNRNRDPWHWFLISMWTSAHGCTILHLGAGMWTRLCKWSKTGCAVQCALSTCFSSVWWEEPPFVAMADLLDTKVRRHCSGLSWRSQRHRLVSLNSSNCNAGINCIKINQNHINIFGLRIVHKILSLHTSIFNKAMFNNRFRKI